MKRSRIPGRMPIAVSLAAVLALLVSACGSGATTESASGEPSKTAGAPTSIRYGMLKSISPIFLSIENGYFADEGLDVSVEFVQSGSDLTPLLASDKFDAGESSAAAGLFNALARDIDVKVVADAGQLHPDTGVAALVARQDLIDSGQLTSLEGLRGKSIAVTAEGSAMHLLIVNALKAQGINESDVKLVTMAFPAMLTALASKEVDAAMLTEPFISQAKDDAQGSIIVPGSELEKDGQQVVLMYSPGLATDSEVGERFMRAWLRGVQAYRAAFGPEAVDKQQAVDALVKHLDMDAAIVEAGLPKGLSEDGAMNRDSLQNRQDSFVEQGLVTSPIPLDSFIDDRFRDKALESLSN